MMLVQIYNFLYRSFSQSCKKVYLAKARQLMQQLSSVGKYED